MMLNVITNEYITSVSKTMHRKLKDSTVAGPQTHVEPTNRFLSTAEDGMNMIAECVNSYIIFIHSFILRIYIALFKRPTQRRSQPSHGYKSVISDTYKRQANLAEASIASLVGGHSRWRDPQSKRLDAV